MKKSLLIKSSAVVLALGVAAGVAAGAYSLKAVEAKAVDEEVYGFTVSASTKTANNSYGGSGTVTIDDVEWNVEGNGTMVPWRLGGKNVSSTTRRVYSSGAVSSANVSKVELVVGNASSVTVNSLTLKVGSDNTFDDYSVSATFSANTTITFERPADADWSNMLFSFEFNVTITDKNSNRFVEFKGANFYQTLASGVQPVIDAIDAIGTVEYTPECKALIDQARALYDELGDDDKALVTNYSTLEAAIDTYDSLAAASVDDLIEAIGPVVSYFQKASIIDARAAYEALTDDQKAKVSLLATLVAAEEAIDAFVPANVVFDLTTATASVISADLVQWSESPVTVDASKGGSTAVNNYMPGGATSANHTRFYNKNPFTFSVEAGYEIYGIEFTVTGDSYFGGLNNDSCWDSNVVISVTGNTVTASVGHKGVRTVTAVPTATGRASSIKVLYGESQDPAIGIVSIGRNLEIEETGSFEAEVKNATNPVVTWESSDPSVLSVEADGSYEALGYGEVTITATLTCDEGTYTATADVAINGGLISIAEANALAATLPSGKQTKYSVLVEGYITNLHASDSTVREVDISDARSGVAGANSIMIYGVYSNHELRNYAILNGLVKVKVNVQNYNGTAELTSPVVVDYVDDAMIYAKESYESLQEACEVGVDAVSQGDWDDLRDNYDALDEFAQAKLSASSAEYAYSEDIAKWYVRYSKIVAGAGYENFMNIEVASVKTSSVIKDNKVMIITVSAVAASLLLVGGLFFFRKKKENN